MVNLKFKEDVEEVADDNVKAVIKENRENETIFGLVFV